jgi:hypothetical protein
MLKQICIVTGNGKQRSKTNIQIKRCKKGCTLSLALFNVYLDHAIKEWQENI